MIKIATGTKNHEHDENEYHERKSEPRPKIFRNISTRGLSYSVLLILIFIESIIFLQMRVIFYSRNYYLSIYTYVER